MTLSGHQIGLEINSRSKSKRTPRKTAYHVESDAFSGAHEISASLNVETVWQQKVLDGYSVHNGIKYSQAKLTRLCRIRLLQIASQPRFPTHVLRTSPDLDQRIPRASTQETYKALTRDDKNMSRHQLCSGQPISRVELLEREIDSSGRVPRSHFDPQHHDTHTVASTRSKHYSIPQPNLYIGINSHDHI